MVLAVGAGVASKWSDSASEDVRRRCGQVWLAGGASEQQDDHSSEEDSENERRRFLDGEVSLTRLLCNMMVVIVFVFELWPREVEREVGVFLKVRVASGVS
mmetsp:Transcript_42895/g.101255  ORF Transcript_42895/g.101255 Transcript_42895/m.101255 type:complete len:101 (+) Transcript_42895:56-358(+)